jgi:hypothetical protein
MTRKKGGRFGKVFRALPAARGWCLYMFMCVYCLNWLGNIQHTKHTVSKTYKVIYSAKNRGFCLQDIDTRRLHRAMIGLHPRSQGIDLKGSSECRQLSIRRRHLQDDESLLRSIVAHGGPTFQEGWPMVSHHKNYLSRIRWKKQLHDSSNPMKINHLDQPFESTMKATRSSTCARGMVMPGLGDMFAFWVRRWRDIFRSTIHLFSWIDNGLTHRSIARFPEGVAYIELQY